MSTPLTSFAKKAQALQSILRNNGLLAKQADQQITHPDLVGGQDNLGKEQTKEHNDSIEGVVASDPKQVAAPQQEPRRDQKGVEDDPNKPAEAALAASGTDVVPAPAEESKAKLASIRAAFAAAESVMVQEQARKQAALKQEEELKKKASAAPAPAAASAAAAEPPMQATQVMRKLAAFNLISDNVGLANEIQQDFVKLAATNPLFNVACEYVARSKMAAEIEALAADEGVPPEVAADALNASIAGDPEAQAELDNEIKGEAVANLANAEGDIGDLMAQLDEQAAAVSEATGTQVTADDLIQAADQVVQQAEAMGVAPEDLIQSAAAKMQGGVQVSPEEEAQAQQILDEAAKQGISPEEVIATAAQALEGGAAAPAAEAPAAPAAAEPAPEASAEDKAKTACLHKLASTKRGKNLIRIITGK